MIFKKLSETEKQEFRQWARDNYKTFDAIKYDLWHPVVVQECIKICQEYAKNEINNTIECYFNHNCTYNEMHITVNCWLSALNRITK